jgi:hypothetical protein
MVPGLFPGDFVFGAGPLALRRFAEVLNVGKVARLRVIDHREAAYNEVFNAMGLEGGQKVFVVLVHPARLSIP